MSSPKSGYYLGVTYEQMIAYVSRASGDIQLSIKQLGDKIDDHNDYHRDTLAEQLASVRSGQIARWSVVIATLAMLGTILGVVLSATGHR